MTADAAVGGPTRTCVGCGARDAQSAMLRVRRGDDGLVVAPPRGGCGRSAYVHGRQDCVRAILRSKGVGRSLRLTATKELRLELMQILDEALACGGTASRPVGSNAGTCA